MQYKLTESPEIALVPIVSKVIRGYYALKDRENASLNTKIGIRAVKEKILPALQEAKLLTPTQDSQYFLQADEEGLLNVDPQVTDLCERILVMWDENENKEQQKWQFGGEALANAMADKVLDIIGPAQEANQKPDKTQEDKLPEEEEDQETEPDKDEPEDTDEALETDKEKSKKKAGVNDNDETKTDEFENSIEEIEAAKAKIKKAFADESKNAYEIGQEVQNEVVKPALEAFKNSEDPEEQQTLLELIKQIIAEIRQEREKARQNQERFPSIHDENSLRNIEAEALVRTLKTAAEVGSDHPAALRADKVISNDGDLSQNTKLGAAMDYQGEANTATEALEALQELADPAVQAAKTEARAAEAQDEAAFENRLAELEATAKETPGKFVDAETKKRWLTEFFEAFKEALASAKENKARRERLANLLAANNLSNTVTTLATEAGLQREGVEDVLQKPEKQTNVSPSGLALDDILTSLANTHGTVVPKSAASPKLTKGSSAIRSDQATDHDTAKPKAAETETDDTEAKEGEKLEIHFTIGFIGRRKKYHIKVDSAAYKLLSQSNFDAEGESEQTKLFETIEAAGIASKKIEAIKGEIKRIGAASPKQVTPLIKAIAEHDNKLKSEDWEKRIMPAGLVSEVK